MRLRPEMKTHPTRNPPKKKNGKPQQKHPKFPIPNSFIQNPTRIHSKKRTKKNRNKLWRLHKNPTYTQIHRPQMQQRIRVSITNFPSHHLALGLRISRSEFERRGWALGLL